MFDATKTACDEAVVALWREAKAAETAAIARRREIEDAMRDRWQIPREFEGAKTFRVGDYKVSLTGRMTRSVDAKAAEEIAKEEGLEMYLDTLFRWKADLNMKAWKSTPDNIVASFEPAITTKPGRMSVKVEVIENKE